MSLAAAAWSFAQVSDSRVDDGEWALLARVSDGDPDAFAALVERHQHRIVRVCERFLGQREAAEDAAQEVFLKLFRRAGSLTPRSRLSTLLYRIAVNHCLNRLRRQRVVRFLSWSQLPRPDQPRLDPPAETSDPEAALLSRERWEWTRRAIAGLPTGQRAVLLLVRFEGLSYRETAVVLGITLGAVESRLVRAMRRLTRAEAGP